MSTFAQVNPERRRLRLGGVALVAAAWAILWAWSMSAYAHWLDHGHLAHMTAPALVRLGVFTVGWTLMTMAMMLPGTLLLLDRSLPGAPAEAHDLAAAIVAYLALWALIGALFYAGDSALHDVVGHAPGVAGLVAPGILLVAGLYQLSPLKRACLSRCRSATTHNGWMQGLKHGLFCVGNCWALMLLMMAVGGTSLLWLLAFAAVMTAERLAQRGFMVAQLLGILLILWWVAAAWRL